MQNVKQSLKGSILTLEIDLNAATTPSTTGKSELIASTHGNQPLAGFKTKDGRIVKVGLTVFTPVPKQ